jgi:hypothetical protein
MMMKNILLQITFLTLTLTSYSYSQWSTDPNNNLIVGYGLDPHICSDSAGGCYITYEYGTTGYPRKLGVERLDNYGYKPWGTLKQILGELEEQWMAEIVEDGQGGVIISYSDDIQVWPNFTYRVRVQRVDSAGNLLWGQTGVRVTTEELNHGVQRLVSDGNGGCVIVWSNELLDYTFDYRANRINNFGERVWSDTGIFLENSIYNDAAGIVRASDGNYYVQTNTIYRINQNGQIVNQYYGNMLGQPVPDPEGGVVLSGVVWTGMIPKLVAQRKDPLGNNLWQEPYVEIADSLYYLNPRFNNQYNDGYYYYGWSGTKYGIAQVAQYQVLRQDGSKLLPQGSIQISNNAPIGRPHIISSDSIRTIFIWNDATISSSTIAQLYDTLGNKLWNENGVVVSYPAIAYQNTTDCQGGFITIGPINQFTIVAQQVSRNGNLGEVIPVPVELVSFTGVADKYKIVLSWITATELNNYGFEILRFTQDDNTWKSLGFVPGFGITTEPKTYSFTDEEVTVGIYKYRLKQIDFDGSFEYSNIVEVAVGIPTKYLLEQNFPNPFNSSTIIKYQIPKDEKVRLNLYNVLGEKMLTLFEGEQEAGKHQVSLSSDELPSGNYFYSLETVTTKQTKKLTIIK